MQRGRGLVPRDRLGATRTSDPLLSALLDLRARRHDEADGNLLIPIGPSAQGGTTRLRRAARRRC